MSPEADERRRRAGLQRGIIILPSAFTLGNLFFGIFAIVSATRGDFQWAAWCIVIAAILDTMDGRIARFTSTGSRFGAELDSLVDAVTFGVAPAIIAYQLFFADLSWSWVLSFIYIAAAVIRLARFNIEQGGHAKRSFHGLPSPTAGMILATVYPFFTAPGVERLLGGLPSAQMVGILMVVLSLLMLSHIPYPLVPRLSVRGPRAILGMLFVVGSGVAALAVPQYFLFPFVCTYTVWGLARATVLGLLDRLPDKDPLLDEPDEDEGGAEVRSVDYGEIAPSRYHSDDALPLRDEHPDGGRDTDHPERKS
ncbi:MAG: CDP-diacylglycerol--serine O-phosphatidyltransferase [Gemmatimonadota bacterium]